jgi:molybdate transport system ATP-binding protein
MSLRVRASLPERGVEVDLELGTGERLALVGPNGAGKSTILQLIAGTLRPRDGSITLDDHELTAVESGRTRTWVPPYARAVTTLSQDPLLFPHLTARGNIVFALRAQGMPRGRARTEASDWLARIGLTGLADRRPSQLSGGQAQQVAIVRALAADPRLLLLDEPMAALDIDVAPALREQLRRVLAERTAIIVSHDVLDSVTLADRIAVIERGRILEQGPTADVLARPQEPFTARLAAVNLVSGIWDGTAVHLGERDGPGRLRGRPARALETGTAVRAMMRPASIGVTRGEEDPRPGTTVLHRTVSGLEVLGDLVRVRAGGIAADLTPQRVAALRLHAGDDVRLEIPDEEVSVYPAHLGRRMDR